MGMTNLKRFLAVLSVVAGLVLATRAKAADEQADARAVLDKAIKAHGGEANLNKFKAVSAKWEGKSRVENMYWDSTIVVTYQMPDKIRLDSELQNPNGGSFSISRVVDGTKGWQGRATQSRDMSAVQVAQILDDMYAPWIASLVPLKDKDFTLSLAGQATVDGKETSGVKVARKGRPDVDLFFDKKTGLLLKSERRIKDPGTTQEYTLESIYSDHKAFQGVLWPTRRHDKRDGNDLDNGAGKFTMSDFQAHDKMEEKLLVKP